MGEVGCQQYFHVKVGLPNEGLDPGFDCHHVSNEELVSVFGERVSHKGYCCDGVTVEKVRSRVWELYPAIWQTSELPEGHHIPESFARAVVSEVCHHYPMNWAKYAEDRWRGKKPEGGDDRVVLYRNADWSDTYFEVICSRLEAEIAEGEGECQSAVADHRVAFLRLQILREAAKPPLSDMDRQKLEIELKFMKEKLISCETKLAKWLDMKPVVEGSADATFLKFYEDEVHCEEQKILQLGEEAQGMKERLSESGLELAEAIEEEKGLLSAKQFVKENLKIRKDNIRKLQQWSFSSLFRAPSPRIAAPTQVIDSITLTVQCCSLCKQGFPVMDLVIASCSCPYHPWCVAVQTSLSDTCARCEEQFAEKWLDSFGYFKCKGPANAGSASDTVEGRKKRGHLNSDIGGWNYTRKDKSSPTCRRKSK